MFVDDSDEPKRAAAGVPAKAAARRQLVHRMLSRYSPIDRERVDLAYDAIDAAFKKVWRDQHVTWTVRERLDVLLAGLGRKLSEPDLAEMVKGHERMELDFRPDPVPGVHEALAALRKGYKLAVVSDTVFTPGWALRELLAGEGILESFDALIFSDELGCSKPNPRAFRAAAEALGVAPQEMVHVGDRAHNDVFGAHEAGALAILLTAAKDRGDEGTHPDAVCGDYRELPGVVDRLAQSDL